MRAFDGKRRKVQAADLQGIFRIIQSIPSKKAEPFKLWLARVGSERLDQLQDPELSIQQALRDYKRLGYSDNWINQRLKSIEIRKDLTDQWDQHGVKDSLEYATLTDFMRPLARVESAVFLLYLPTVYLFLLRLCALTAMWRLHRGRNFSIHCD